MSCNFLQPLLETLNLPCEERIIFLDSERLTGALLDRLTQRAHTQAIEGKS